MTSIVPAVWTCGAHPKDAGRGKRPKTAANIWIRSFELALVQLQCVAPKKFCVDKQWVAGRASNGILKRISDEAKDGCTQIVWLAFVEDCCTSDV
jgi:hypothetical protein